MIIKLGMYMYDTSARPHPLEDHHVKLLYILELEGTGYPPPLSPPCREYHVAHTDV